MKMDEIRYWIETEGAGHWFFVAFPICLLFLFVWFKGRRVRFLIPSLLISIVIINPVFFQKWDELGLYAYWRILWVVPVISILAAFVPAITEKLQKTWAKVVVAISGIALIIFGGTFLYNGAGGSFVEAADASKLPENVVAIADRLLELDEHPRIIADPSISTYIRQYTGSIDTLYGRDLYGYIMSPASLATSTNKALINEDMDFVSQTMADENYSFLVYRGDAGIDFELIDSVGDFSIYRTLKRPTVTKEYNELGQVVSVTTLDDSGAPIDGLAGYSTTSYLYARNGFVCREIYTNVRGDIVVDSYGCCGYERDYDQSGHKIMERYIGSDGKPVLNGLGYAEYRREYLDDHHVIESYYGINGELKNCINGYACNEKAYDNNWNIILQRFMDENGNMVNTGSGYAEVHRIYDGENLILEEYYGSDGMPYDQVAGYCAIEQTWEDSVLVSRTYLGSEGLPVERVDGYSKAVWRQDSDGIWDVGFRNIDDNEVPNDELNLVRDVHVGIDGWSDWITPIQNSFNYVIPVGKFNLGEGMSGDQYTIHVEIEFSNVTSPEGADFIFRTVGMVDSSWNDWAEKNIWNSSFVYIDHIPEDGVYEFEMTRTATNEMLSTNTCDIGFRCDYWSSGSFRVRDIKIEKSEKSSPWSPGL